MVEKWCVILPVRQCARLILCRAAFSDLPRTAGTMQAGFAAKIAVADLVRFIVTLQGPVPEQAPDQPLKMEPLEGEAISVTLVP